MKGEKKMPMKEMPKKEMPMKPAGGMPNCVKMMEGMKKMK